MDPRFQVNDPPRTTAAQVSAETPLVTIAWRALHAEHRRSEREARRVQEALGSIAEEVYRLRRAVPAAPEETGKPNEVQQLWTIADRLEGALARIDVEIVAPEGAPYIGPLVELLDNVAQRPDPAIQEPRIAEVIAPAVIQHDTILRRGKAVIAVPPARSG